MMKFPIFSSADALEIRSKLGMNQTDFWSPFGVTQSCGSRYESSRSIPRPVQILLAAKYGKLATDWRDDMRAGFAECFRVLKPHGTLVFKWNETQIKVKEVLACTPHKPLYGQVSGRRGMTHWLVFMKAPA